MSNVLRYFETLHLLSQEGGYYLDGADRKRMESSMDMLKIGRPKKKKSLICTNFPTYMGLILTDFEESNRITLEKR